MWKETYIKGKVIIKKNIPITIHEKIMNEAINGDETIYENYGKNKVCLSETSTSQTHLFCYYSKGYYT